MLLSRLRDKKVIGLDGRNLGRVHEVHCQGGQVTALMVGAASWIERITARKHGKRIDWPLVREVTDDHIRVDTDAAKSRPKLRPRPKQSR